MKTLVLGSAGQLGRALEATTPDSVEFIGANSSQLDITNAEIVREKCRQIRPSVIINAAAYTGVDKAESEAELAAAVNSEGARTIANAANNVGARLIQLSTDFVFDGQASEPYKTTAAPNPINIYGRTKLEGERAVLDVIPDRVLVLRTAWLYSRFGNNFVKTMLKLIMQSENINVVTDQTGTPTWTESLAQTIWGFVQSPTLFGIYHWTDGGVASWHELADAIQEEAFAMKLIERRASIQAISTADYPTAAQRPRYSVLDISKTCNDLGCQPVHWRVNLRKMLENWAS